MKAYGITDIGKTRAVNQDVYKIAELDENCGVAVVCDGMGGPGGGQIASAIAADVILEKIKESFRKECTEKEIRVLLTKAILAANEAVFNRSVLDEQFKGMGTTAVVALYLQNTVYFASVGDSRAYVIKENKLMQVTKDHSVVQDMLDSGKISKFEARTHPQKNIITKAVGVEPRCAPDFYKASLAENESVMLCTDGLTSYVDENEILFELSLGDPVDEVLSKFVLIANEKGGSDNITVVIIA